MELSLGPILFDWKRSDVLRFYEEAAGMEVDRVYLGEVVCIRKKGLRVEDVRDIAELLTKAGKKVVLSSLAVVSNEDELGLVRELSSMPYAVEANDMSVFNIVDASKREVIAGPHILTYNVPSIDFLKGIGVKRVVFPVELSMESIAYNIRHTGITGEVFAHGKAPLAFSWRCYTSRARGLTKTNCRHHCAEFPDGMEIKNLDGEMVFTVNGTSVLSASTYTLVEHVEGLKDAGVSALRISPHYRDTAKLVRIFRSRVDGSMTAEEGLKEIKGLGYTALSNGWYAGGAGKDFIERAGA